jgi:hypothetical protein
VQLALRLANDAGFNAHCRDRIAASSDVLFEDMDFIRQCEQALKAMVAECAAATMPQ